MNKNSVGSFIGAKRREKNLTQEQLAEKLGVSNKTVSKWETGKCLPDYAIIEQLCAVLDITVAELLDGEESSNRVCDEKQYQLLLYKLQQMEDKIRQAETKGTNVDKSVHVGLTFGSALAMVISYINWNSIGWAILHGCLGWLYVIYYLIRY